MQFHELVNSMRLGCEDVPESEDIASRSEFKRDFDRILFSPAFRRLQGKTQVFPFPDNDHIHNRLTHSLEVYSIARSLGTLCSISLDKVKYPPEIVGDIVGAAGLAHDIGNTPFGHSGEDAFMRFFSGEGSKLIGSFTKQQKADFKRFEGNAMGFRILTHSKPLIKKNEGGLGLTYSTLASFIKYPTRSSLAGDKNNISEKKHSFCESEERYVSRIFDKFNISKKKDGKWPRFPLSFLVEAADDIAYHIIDFEDGYRLNLVGFDKVRQLFSNIVSDFDSSELKKLDNITDNNGAIGFLRSKAINSLIHQVVDEFVSKWSEISTFTFDRPLFETIKSAKHIMDIDDISRPNLYNAKPVAEIEITGYEIISGLLNIFVNSLLCEPDNTLGKKVKVLLPKEFYYKSNDETFSGYELVLNISEYICCMTDTFALNLFRKLKGIEIPQY
jgi:dGTPase